MRRIVGLALGVGAVSLVYNRERLLDGTLDFIAERNDRRRHLQLPKRIFIVRHGESEGNVNHQIYKTVPDNSLELTQKGFEQADRAGARIKEIVGDETVEFYLSPFQRTFQTSRTILNHFPDQIVRVDIEPRLREQEFGNTQDPEQMPAIRREQQAVGRFWYRFPGGESGADVYHRVASFWTEFKNTHLHIHQTHENAENVVIITHGLTMRFILSVMNRWSPDTFETVWNPNNCDIWVLDYDKAKQRYYINEKLSDKIRSSRRVRVYYKDGTSETKEVQDYLSLPQPRTENPVLACKKMNIDPDCVDSIDWWNGKFKSNFKYGDNTPDSIVQRRQLAEHKQKQDNCKQL